METLKAVLNARYDRYQKEIELEMKKCNYSKAAELSHRSSEINKVLLDMLNIEYETTCTQEAK